MCGMKLLTIGSDRNLFKEGSDVWNRYLDYGKLFEEIHVIVFSSKRLNNKKNQIGENVFVYPTNHICKFFYLWNIYKISKGIIINCKLKIKNCCDNFVITTQDPFEAGLAGWIIKKIYKIPLQLQIHTDFLSPYFKNESFLNKIRVLLAKFLIPRADGVRVVSERIRQSLVACHMSHVAKIAVLPIFVDTEKIKTSLIKTNLHNKYPQFDFIVLMASRLTKEKNINLALESMAELVKKYPKLGLVIVGSGPERDSLQGLIVNGQLSNVIMESFVDQETLFSYYKTADLFLLASNYEGYGRSIIEAMSADLPVITTDVGLVGDVLINNESGLIIPVDDKKELSSAISILIRDKQKREDFSLKGKEIAANLMTKGKYLKLYKQIV
jgi:glycosyltransferase involved in cell wall biosynthesis